MRPLRWTRLRRGSASTRHILAPQLRVQDPGAIRHVHDERFVGGIPPAIDTGARALCVAD